MSLNTPLSKELRLIQQMFYRAASRSRLSDEDADDAIAGDTDCVDTDLLVLAGGAVRDLYFDRPEPRDVDLYFDSRHVNVELFAKNLQRMSSEGTPEFGRMARAAGFSTVAVERLNKSQVPQATRDVFYVPPPVPGQIAGIPPGHYLNGQGTASNPWSNQSIQQQPAPLTGSGSGSKSDPHGRAHPLQAVEEFVVYLDGDRYFVELMSVAMSPINYINTHFAVKLSRCYYDGKQVVYTRDFFEDARNKTITVACPVQHARFERLFSYYLPKLQTYFPSFEIKVDLKQMNRPSPRFGNHP